MTALSSYNAFQLMYFTFNSQTIAEEMCVNRDTEITQCKGMCYLADQVVEVEETSQQLDMTTVKVNLNFMFYFFQLEDQQTAWNVRDYKTWYSLIDKTHAGYYDIQIPPPSSC